MGSCKSPVKMRLFDFNFGWVKEEEIKGLKEKLLHLIKEN
jgi:hypothetical protein